MFGMPLETTVDSAAAPLLKNDLIKPLTDAP